LDTRKGTNGSVMKFAAMEEGKCENVREREWGWEMI
jgi:hypothetical protein